MSVGRYALFNIGKAIVGIGVVLSSTTSCASQDVSESIVTSEESASALSVAGDGAARRYIVVFKPRTASQLATGETMADIASALARKSGGRTVLTYQHALEGVAMDLPTAEALKAIQADSRVAYVEPDQVTSIVTVPGTAASVQELGAVAGSQPTPPSWGLDRVDQRSLPLNQIYNYPAPNGAGVHVYVIHSGIYAAHSEFTGRVGAGYDVVDGDSNPNDCYGQGTHLAATIAGTSYGLAKQATVHAVRAFDCSGSGFLSRTIAAVDWVTSNKIAPALANMPVYFASSQALNAAVNASIAAGVSYVVTAGVDGVDACQGSPASVSNAVTVGATDNADTRPSWSNYGACVDLFAPGKDITSAWISPDLTKTISGSAAASAHVAGLAALYLSAHKAATPAQVATALIDLSTKNVIQNPGAGSPNRLAYVPPAWPCTNICSNPSTFSTVNGSYQSGSLGTGALCKDVFSAPVSGNCGNFLSPRTLAVNGTQKTCNGQTWSFPASNNGHCVRITQGNYSWAYMTAW